MKKKLYLLLISIIVLIACDGITSNRKLVTDLSAWLNLPSSYFNYSNITLPNHYTHPAIENSDNTPNSNPITDAGATLGRVLFYDKNLSKNNTIACASCHQQSSGFSDQSKLSTGFDGGKTGRNSMGLANARFYNNGRFFWDERAETLEDQTTMPIQDHVEMGMDLDSLVDKLSQLEYYPTLFDAAFNSKAITVSNIENALSQFIRSMVSYESKYDQALEELGRSPRPGDDLPGFTAQENLGHQVFLDPQRGACAGCHGTEAFIAPEARNNGLDATTTDQGLGAVTNNQNDDGKFKVPSLRNIAETKPYMHDGRFATLEDVVEHYNSGVQNHPNLDNRLKVPGTNTVRRLNLTESEKSALVAFLKTLSDHEFMSKEMYSDPFH